MKKNVSLLLVAVLVVSMLTMTAFAVDSPQRPEKYTAGIVDATTGARASSIWSPGSGVSLAVETDIPSTALTGVLLDGKALSPNDYTVGTNNSGMVVITFSDEFLGTLGPGDHTIAVQTADGQASAALTVGYIARIKSGAKDGVWTKGSGEEIVFESNADFSKFVSVSVDNAVVDSANYTAKSGSTDIYMKVAYLETLSTGKHEITIVSSDGSATAEFTVAPKSADGTTDTNDLTNTVLWVAIALIALGAIGFFAVGLKRSKAEK